MPGGIGAYVEAMCRLLPARARADGDTLVGLIAWHRRRPEVGLPLRQVRAPARLLTVAWQFLRRPRLPDFDVVLAPSLAVPPPGPAALVVFCADLAFLEMPAAYPLWGRLFHRRGLANARRDAQLVLTCSEASAHDLSELGGIPADRVRVIPLGVDRRSLSKDEAAERRRRLGVQGPFFLSLATREPRKNLSAVLAAFGLLADLPEKLVVAGPRGWLETEAPRGEGVVVLGRVDDDDKAALYMGATAFCYPSLYEGFGLPVAEAMTYGAPVVTSNVSSLPEVAGDAALLVDPHDIEAIAHALRRLALEPGLRAERVAAGQAQAARFTWEASADATWKALKEAVA